MGDGRASQRTPSSNTTGDVTAEPKAQAEPTPTSKTLGITGTCTTSPSAEYCDLSHIFNITQISFLRITSSKF